ncbi:MAG: hypothetical protein LBI05_05190 [Planctomycetaceae bacterium]|nr:hypothetical protein [Planctomycetaceae bacterium]
MKTLTNRLTEEQMAELRRRHEKASSATVPGSQNRTTSPPSPEPPKPRYNPVGTNTAATRYNPVGANTAATRYNGGCGGCGR